MNFSKICLLVIALSLAMIALRPVLRPQPVAAASHYKYLVVDVIYGGNKRAPAMQEQLTKQDSEGWEFVTATAADGNVQLIFRKAN